MEESSVSSEPSMVVEEPQSTVKVVEPESVVKEEPKVEKKPDVPFIDVVRSGKTYRGKKELIAHLEGKPITKAQAIIAKCYDCMGFYEDGAVLCECKDCPLYPFMPFNKAKRKTKVLSEEHKAALKAARKKK